MNVRALIDGLLVSMQEYLMLGDVTLGERTRAAMHAVPRHLFVPKYFANGAWGTPGEDDWPLLYRDDGFGIGVDATGDMVTISRPAWVAYLLELLQVEEGDRVFEVGTGSGWNAALLGHLAGPTGSVQSFEIIPELAAQARRAIASAGIENVEVGEGDAALAAPGAPFDRIIFTAGSYDIPDWMHERIRPGGLLVMALKLPGGGDFVILFRRDEERFVAIRSRACEVVWMRGKTRDAALDPVRLDDFAPWAGFRERLRATRSFAFGGHGAASLAQRTVGLRSYLALCESRMRWFVGDTGWPYYFYGLVDGDSFALVRDGRLDSYGGPAAAEALVARLHDWVDAGMPSAESMPLRAYPAGKAPPARPGEIVIHRAATDFVWTLKT